jgi:hypothetical protein
MPTEKQYAVGISANGTLIHSSRYGSLRRCLSSGLSKVILSQYDKFSAYLVRLNKSKANYA